MDLWNTIKLTDTLIWESQREKRRRIEQEEYLKKHGQNFPKSDEGHESTNWKNLWPLSRIASKRTTSRNIIVKLLNAKNKESWKQQEQSDLLRSKDLQ